MLTHKQVWNAIDTIAERYGFSASGLAKKSGLDPTSFNPSKRNGPDGRPRWPTMESISRLLQASGASMEEFSELLIGRRGQPPKLRQIPLLGLAKAGKVTLLPHMGSATQEGRVDMGEKVIINVKAFLDGHRPPDRVLPSML